MTMPLRACAKNRRGVTLVAIVCLLVAPLTAQAQTFVEGSVYLTSLFGPNPAVPLGWFTAAQTASGNLSVPAQPRNVSQSRQTVINSGVLVSFAHVTTVTGIGPGVLVNNHQPGGTASPKPVTFSPTTNLPAIDLSEGPANFRVGYRDASARYGGTLSIAGRGVDIGRFQLSPATNRIQIADRPFNGGRAATDASQFPVVTRTVSVPGSTAIGTATRTESRFGFPWTTGSISAVGLFGNPVPYGGAGIFGTPSQAPPFQTVAGGDSRVFNTAVGELTGNLQLVSPAILASVTSSGGTSTPFFWTLDLRVVPEPGSVLALGGGLALLAGLAMARRRG